MPLEVLFIGRQSRKREVARPEATVPPRPASSPSPCAALLPSPLSPRGRLLIRYLAGAPLTLPALSALAAAPAVAPAAALLAGLTSCEEAVDSPASFGPLASAVAAAAAAGGSRHSSSRLGLASSADVDAEAEARGQAWGGGSSSGVVGRADGGSGGNARAASTRCSCS